MREAMHSIRDRRPGTANPAAVLLLAPAVASDAAISVRCWPLLPWFYETRLAGCDGRCSRL